MTPIIDIHTHRLDAGPNAIISVEPAAFAPQPGHLYSVGYHPWSPTPTSLSQLEAVTTQSQVIAIGETGIDALRGASIAEQEQLFAQHIALAQQLGKPVIAHMVRTSQQLIKVWHRMQPCGISLIIHGMRGNANVARTLIEAGCYLSYGERFNPNALQATPLDRILAETDESPLSITQIIDAMSQTLGTTPQYLTSHITNNTLSALNKNK